jgi:hypothetical protein
MGETMPFKSKAQRRKFAQLLVEGKIQPDTYEEWNRETGSAQLPERLHPAPGKTTTRGGTKKSAARKKKTARSKRRLKR